MYSTIGLASPAHGSSIPRGVWMFLAVWFGAAAVFAAAGWLERLPPYFIPIVIWSQVLLVAAVLWRSTAARSAVARVPVSAMVAFHVLRAPIGAAFLIVEAMGLLTPKFALPAGIGDLAVGVLAMPVVFLAQRRLVESRRLIRFWNWFGLCDILIVFVTAQRILLFGEGPSAMRAFFIFPAQLIPLYVVPLVLLTHGLIHLGLREAAPQAQ
jgi:hypothetical protein